MRRKVSRPAVALPGGTFVVVASGYADGPSQPFVRFLNEQGAGRVTVVTHPLVPEGPGEHWVDEYVHGEPRPRKARTLPNRPPYSYAVDPFSPLLLPKADVWVGFNCLATSQGLVRRRFGRVKRVIHWNVDFAPERFGASPVTRLYEWLDRKCVTSADGRVELSEAAHEGRLRAYHLAPGANRAAVIPMGSWTDDGPRCNVRCLEAPRLVFLGHLVERMGVPLVLDLAEALRDRGRSVPIDIVGGGPMLAQLQAVTTARGLGDVVTYHGFLPDFADVQRLLAGAAIALAPYETDESSFSRFADPGKLKAYLGAGLPVMLTPVPPNAHEMAREGGAQLLPPDSTTFADAVVAILDDRREWSRRHAAATEYAIRFDWGHLFTAALPQLGILLGPGAPPDKRLAQ